MAIFRLLFRRGLRVSLIAVLVGLVLGFGHFMTPRTPDAHAKWVHKLGRVLTDPGVPEYMRMRVADDEVQEVSLNGNTLYYTLNRTSKDIPTLLDYYENLYKADRVIAPEAARKAILEKIPTEAKRKEHARRIEATERILNDRHVRFDGEGWGGFATIVSGKEAQSDYQKAMVERFQSFQKTGLTTDLGTPKIVIAFEDPSQGNTQYFNVWPDQEFDQQASRPKDKEDTPGFDHADIDRPRDSQRLVTFTQDHEGTSYSIHMYESPGSTEEVLEDFVESMQASGWALSERFAQARGQSDSPEPAMLFSKETREAYVALSTVDDSGGVHSTLVVYDHGS